MGGPRSQADRPPKQPMPVRLAAEALGAFGLTFVAAGAESMASLGVAEIDSMARAVAPGLLVLAFIYAIGDVSGAHFNPAVTLALAVRGLFPIAWVPLYVGAQLVGAAGAGFVLTALFGGAASAGVSIPHVAQITAVALEAILTAVLVLVILGTADRYEIIGPNAAFAVGATIALCGLIAGPIEGASMNPARSFGPALAVGELGDLWIYVVGPLIGATAAVGLDRAVHGPSPPNAAKEAAQG